MSAQIEQPTHEVDHENNQENTQERVSTEKDLNHIRQGDVLYHERTKTSGPETLIQETADDSRSFKRESFATPNYGELEQHEDPCSSLAFSHERSLSSDTSASYHTAHSRRSTSPESQSGHDQETALETSADKSCCKCYVQA